MKLKICFRTLIFSSLVFNLSAFANDPTFGDHGVARYVFPATTGLPSRVEPAHPFLVQKNGKLLISATTYNSEGGREGNNLAVLRFNADGSKDTSFGKDGVSIQPFNIGSFVSPLSLYETSDHKILISGLEKYNLIVARYTEKGELDTTFGTSGYLKIGYKGNTLLGLLARSDGSLVVPDHGACSDTSGITITLLPSGGVQPCIPMDVLPWGYSSALQSDDKLLLANTVMQNGKRGFILNLVRINSDGTVDKNFADNGRAQLSWNSETASHIVVSPTGQILVVGSNRSSSGEIARFSKDGHPDSSFGKAGTVSGFGYVWDDRNHPMLITSDGSFYTLAKTEKGDSITRFTSRGEKDSKFASHGQIDFANAAHGLSWTDMGIQKTDSDSEPRLVVTRLIYADGHWTLELRRFLILPK